MFLIRFIRFLFSYVSFSGSKGFPERFINLCSVNNIHLWDVKCKNSSIIGKTSVRSYKKIRRCAFKSGMKIHIDSRHGLYFILKPWFCRKGLAVGIAVSLVTICILNSFIWCVSVSGNKDYTSEQIMSVADQLGLYTGVEKQSVVMSSLRSRLQRSINDIRWCSVNIEGSCASIIISENENDSEIFSNEKPCNIVSEADGVIIKITAYRGKIAAKQGSGIHKGDLLISGVIGRTDGSTRFVHAVGEATLKTQREISVSLPTKLTVSKAQKLPRRLTIVFYGLKIPLGFKRNHDMHSSVTMNLCYYKTVLPIGTISEKFSRVHTGVIQLSQSQTALLDGYMFFNSETEIMTKTETISKKITISSSDTFYNIKCNYTNLEKTGIEQYIEIN